LRHCYAAICRDLQSAYVSIAEHLVAKLASITKSTEGLAQGFAVHPNLNVVRGLARTIPPNSTADALLYPGDLVAFALGGRARGANDCRNAWFAPFRLLVAVEIEERACPFI
jgi:hypothetical protein